MRARRLCQLAYFMSCQLKHCCDRFCAVSAHDTRCLEAGLPRWCPADVAPSKLSNGDVHLWRISIDPEVQPRATDIAGTLLTADEATRATRFQTPQLGGRWILGRAAMRLILSHYSGLSARAIVIGRGAHGKPLMRTAPGARLTPSFNLSHSANLALMAICRRGLIGVDLERIRKVPNASRIADLLFSPNGPEQPFRARSDGGSLDLLRRWTCMESILKARGEGWARPAGGFNEALRASAATQQQRPSDSVDNRCQWLVLSFKPAAGYVGALAVGSAEIRLSCFEFAFRPGLTGV